MDEVWAMSEGLPVHQQEFITLSASGSLTRVDESLSTVSDLVIDIEIVRFFFKNSSLKSYFETCQNGLF